MDFAPAAMALIDDDQKGAVKSLFAEMTYLACKLVDKYCSIGLHLTDSISMMTGFAESAIFSQEVAEELFVPYMKELTDHIHSKGRYVTLHSCGCNQTRIKCFIDGGFDGWEPQTMNDSHKLWNDYGEQICISVLPINLTRRKQAKMNSAVTVGIRRMLQHTR